MAAAPLQVGGHNLIGMSVAAAWSRVVFDCGCADIYYCPAADEVECPRHGGFSACCNRQNDHVEVPAELRWGDPRPPVPPDEDD